MAAVAAGGYLLISSLRRSTGCYKKMDVGEWNALEDVAGVSILAVVGLSLACFTYRACRSLQTTARMNDSSPPLPTTRRKRRNLNAATFNENTSSASEYSSALENLNDVREQASASQFSKGEGDRPAWSILNQSLFPLKNLETTRDDEPTIRHHSPPFVSSILAASKAPSIKGMSTFNLSTAGTPSTAGRRWLKKRLRMSEGDIALEKILKEQEKFVKRNPFLRDKPVLRMVINRLLDEGMNRPEGRAIISEDNVSMSQY